MYIFRKLNAQSYNLQFRKNLAYFNIFYKSPSDKTLLFYCIIEINRENIIHREVTINDNTTDWK